MGFARFLIWLAAWMETRFPEKVQVKTTDYSAMVEKLEQTHLTVANLVSRMFSLEKTAVHTDAVKDLIVVVKLLKEEIQAMKFGIGMADTIKPEQVLANLNGEPILGGN